MANFPRIGLGLMKGGFGGEAFSIAKSFYLDVNGYFSATPNAGITSMSTGTISVLFKSGDYSTANARSIFTIDNGTDFFTIRFFSNKFDVFYKKSGVIQWILRATATPIQSNNWYNLVVVQDGIEPIVYLNNVVEAQSFVISTDKTLFISDLTPTNMNVGTQIIDGWEFKGYISSVSIINQVLDASEVADLYNNGKPKDPQALFGSNCKYFFNPDNSGDTAQFTVTDSVNSITATSVNMTDADKTPITPYSDPLADLVTKYGFLNAWSGENVEINGTTTTAKDYLLEHDLANPTIASQLSFVGASADFGNRPVLFFNVDDYLYKATANWRSADSSGVFIVVFSAPTTTYGVISTSDETTNSAWYAVGNSAFKSSMLKSGANHITTLTDDTTAKVVGMSGDGVNLKGWLNGVDDTDTTGSYGWLDDFPTQRDNIVIGGVQRSSALYSANTYIAFVGYLPYTDDATIIACQNELKTIFGI
jgi:Concanavalin A-like lectin/glucanases superfamily